MSRQKDKKPNTENPIEEIVEKEIEFICPVRGKVKQLVKVKRLKSVESYNQSYIRTGDPLIDDFPLNLGFSTDEE